MRHTIVRIIAVAVLGLAAGLLVGATLSAFAPLPAGRILIRSPIVLHPQRETVTARETAPPTGATAVADPISPMAPSSRVTARAATNVPASPRPRAARVPVPLTTARTPARVLVNPFEIGEPGPASLPVILPTGGNPVVAPVPTPAAPSDPVVRTQALEANRAETDGPRPPAVTVAAGASGAAGKSRTARTTSVERNESR